MRFSVLLLSAVVVSGIFAGCMIDGHCYQSSAQWTEPGIFDAIGLTATHESPAEPGLPISGTSIHDRWPEATIEGVTWLPAATGRSFSEPGHGVDFRAEPVIQLFAPREDYGDRPGWPHSYPYGHSIDVPGDPFLVVVVTEPDTPADLLDEIASFLDHLGISAMAHQDILAHLEAHKEKHTGVRDLETGNTTWKYGHWAPISDLSALDPFLASFQSEYRVESRSVGWTGLIFDPEWKITLDQPVRGLEIESSIGTITVDIDGSDVVYATSPKHYEEDEAHFRSALQDAFQKSGLPVTSLGEAIVDRTSDC